MFFEEIQLNKFTFWSGVNEALKSTINAIKILLKFL